MASARRQQWRIRLLTPLHIGCGQTLVEQFDWKRFSNETLVLDQERIWNDMLGRDQAVNLALLHRPPAELLKPADLQSGSPYVRYRLRGLPRGSDQHELQAVIKDVYGRPYIPGSSLKGALRTVLLWALVNERSATLDLAQFSRNPQTAAQAVEQDYFGRDPNHDLLRALRVGDSTPTSPENLALCAVYAFGPANPIPINIEAIKPSKELELHCTVSIDNWLTEQDDLKFYGRAVEMLSDLPALARAWTQVRLQEERNYLHRRGWNSAAQYVDKFLSSNLTRLPADAFLLQLGWGTGWLGKTIGPALTAEQREVAINTYHLSRGHRQQGNAFPASRRLTSSKEGQEILPYAPLGWLRIDTAPVEERQHEAD